IAHARLLSLGISYKVSDVKKRRTPSEVGALIRDRRIERGWTNQGDIGSPATIGKMERGEASKFRRQTLQRAADRLGWPVDFYERLQRGDDPSSLELGRNGATAATVAGAPSLG